MKSPVATFSVPDPTTLWVNVCPCLTGISPSVRNIDVNITDWKPEFPKYRTCQAHELWLVHFVIDFQVDSTRHRRALVPLLGHLKPSGGSNYGTVESFFLASGWWKRNYRQTEWSRDLRHKLHRYNAITSSTPIQSHSWIFYTSIATSKRISLAKLEQFLSPKTQCVRNDQWITERLWPTLWFRKFTTQAARFSGASC